MDDKVVKPKKHKAKDICIKDNSENIEKDKAISDLKSVLNQIVLKNDLQDIKYNRTYVSNIADYLKNHEDIKRKMSLIQEYRKARLEIKLNLPNRFLTYMVTITILLVILSVVISLNNIKGAWVISLTSAMLLVPILIELSILWRDSKDEFLVQKILKQINPTFEDNQLDGAVLWFVSNNIKLNFANYDLYLVEEDKPKNDSISLINIVDKVSKESYIIYPKIKVGDKTWAVIPYDIFSKKGFLKTYQSLIELSNRYKVNELAGKVYNTDEEVTALLLSRYFALGGLEKWIL